MQVNNPPNDFLARAYALSSVDGARGLYDEWAGSYDEYLEQQDYASPSITVDAILGCLKSKDVSLPAGPFQILDAGCGTGLVGVGLSQRLASEYPGHEVEIDGIDLSPGMLDRARLTKVYSSLEEADMSKALERPDEMYDIVACVGTLTEGHVGPSVLREFARIVKKGGIVAVTIIEKIYESRGYAAEIDRLREDAGMKMEMIHDQVFGVTKSTSTGCKMLVLKRV